eukprot:Gb_19866 [translate_table: standard]
MGRLTWKEWTEFWKRPTSHMKPTTQPTMEYDQECVIDGSVDLKGRLVLRSTIGGWMASLSSIGVAILARNVNKWTGVTIVMPLLGGFLADAYFGCYWMVLISSFMYLLVGIDFIDTISIPLSPQASTIGILLAVIVVVYIQDNISCGFGFGIPTTTMAISIALFLYGTPFYRHRIPGASSITSIAQVIVVVNSRANRCTKSRLLEGTTLSVVE